MLFVVGTHFQRLPQEAAALPVGELLPLYRRILRYEWDGHIATIRAQEMAVGMALLQTFNAKKVTMPKLPTFDELLRSKLPLEERLPAWMRKFEAANKRDAPPE